MKVVVTGGSGFAGRWLQRELENAGHSVEPLAIDEARVDVTDRGAVLAAMAVTRPAAIAHLAAISFGPDVDSGLGRALSIAVRGTINIIDAASMLQPVAPVLVTGSADVYGRPDPGDLPLTERAPITPYRAYGVIKAAQEAIALEVGQARGVQVVVTRSFNHIGPGQRPEFAIPSFARRILQARRDRQPTIRVGNVDVRRDWLDVRDVVRAYRLLLELAVRGQPSVRGLVLNVASGRSTAVRDVIAELARQVGIEIRVVVDESLVRPGEPSDLLGDATLLRRLTDWQPAISLPETLADVVAEIRSEG